MKAQKEIDKNKIEYFEAKCEIVIQKIRYDCQFSLSMITAVSIFWLSQLSINLTVLFRAEMMEIQLDTYTEDTISAHRKIK